MTTAIKRSFTDTVAALRYESLAAELDTALQSLVLKCQETGRSGELVLKLKVKPSKTGPFEIVDALRQCRDALDHHQDQTRPIYRTAKALTAADTALAALSEPTDCQCEACKPMAVSVRMILCSICGNKRCPHAADHRNACTNSNEPGQPGSSYPAIDRASLAPAPQPAPVQGEVPMPEPDVPLVRGGCYTAAKVRAYGDARALAERERCAAVCEAVRPAGGRMWDERQHASFEALTHAADNIREYGDARALAAVREPLSDAAIVAAARALNKLHAEACGVDAGDSWTHYSDDFKADARVVLNAAAQAQQEGK